MALIREHANGEHLRIARPYKIYGIPSWKIPIARMTIAIEGVTGVGEKKTNGIPTIAVNI